MMKGDKIMFFDFFGNADKNGDGKVDMWEAAEQVYAFDTVMGTNFSGFYPEHDRKEPDDDMEIEEECDRLYDNEYLGDVFDDEEEDLFDDEFDDDDELDDGFGDDCCDEW